MPVKHLPDWAVTAEKVQQAIQKIIESGSPRKIIWKDAVKFYTNVRQS